MTGYVPRYTKRIEQCHKRERKLLGALKRGDDQARLTEAAEAVREAKLAMVKSATANKREGIQVSDDREGPAFSDSISIVDK